VTDDLRLDLLGPLRGWSGDRRLDLGPMLAKGDLTRARPYFARAMELALDDGQESMILRAASGLARTSPAA
jgi:hypothetical protein